MLTWHGGLQFFLGPAYGNYQKNNQTTLAQHILQDSSLPFSLVIFLSLSLPLSLTLCLPLAKLGELDQGVLQAKPPPQMFIDLTDILRLDAFSTATQTKFISTPLSFFFFFLTFLVVKGRRRGLFSNLLKKTI